MTAAAGIAVVDVLDTDVDTSEIFTGGVCLKELKTGADSPYDLPGVPDSGEGGAEAIEVGRRTSITSAAAGCTTAPFSLRGSILEGAVADVIAREGSCESAG
jgi:hypothetical protein